MPQPAARVGDMHVCPMVTPAVPPVPHVGGPVLPPGGLTVLIGGVPAARVGDLAVCVGPPDVIALGDGLPLELTFSCIRPIDGLHCGVCSKCAERRDGFRDAGRVDRTRYAETQ